MSVIIDRLSKQYGKKVLFNEASATLSPPMKVGVIGANGAGKSTLLRIISGEESADSGTVSIPKAIRLGVLTQDHFAFEKETILNVVWRGRPRIWNALVDRNRILDTPEPDGEALANAELELIEAGYHEAEAEAAEILAGLGFQSSQIEDLMSTLSGGYKLRVLLAQVLFGNPEILILDEPTNHLDLASIQWLEEFIRTRRSLVIFVSHDREFINAVATHVLDVDYQTFTVYTGNFEAFVKEKVLRRELLEKARKAQEAKISQLQEFVDRFGSKASLASRAQSKVKQIEKMESIELADSSRRHPRLQFSQKRPSGKDVLNVENLEFGYSDTPLFQNVSFFVERGARLGIIGPNGVGKSTLLKCVLDKLTPQNGKSRWGHETHISYFAQDHHEGLPGDRTAFEYLQECFPLETQTVVRGTLGSVLLSGDEALKPISNLSGGEAGRLILARMMLERPNVLILDEPTNHLDLESIESLTEALQKFEGTLLFVSHDRQFVRELATQILEIQPEHATAFPGTFAEFLVREGRDHLSKKAHRDQRDGSRSNAKQKPKPAHDSRENRNQSTKQKREIESLEMQIQQLERDIQVEESTLAEGDWSSTSAREKAKIITSDIETMKTKLTELWARWEAITGSS